MHEGVYLLHFDPPYLHAQHYLGWSHDIAARVHQHASGGSRSSPLVQAALANGSRIRLARVWLGADRNFERTLKNRRYARRICPECRARVSRQVSA